MALKARAGSRLRFNESGFYNDFKNFQADRIGLGGAAELAINAPRAVSWGMDTESTLQVSDAISFNAGLTWLGEAKFTDFAIPADSVTQTTAFNATGNRLAGAAKVSAVLGAQFKYALSPGALVFDVHGNYNSGVFYDVENFVGSGGIKDSPYAVVNAALSYHSMDGKYAVKPWVENLTDENYFASGLNTAGGAIRLGIDNPPRHFGITGTVRF